MIERRANGMYRARVYHRSKYVTGATFRRRTDAVAWERRQKDALAAGTWVPPADADVTVRDWVDSWWAARALRKPSTVARYRSLLDRYVLPEWGRRPLVGIAPMEVQKWASELAEKKSVSTARQALVLLRGALAAAVLEGRLTRNPAAGIRLPRVPAGEPRPLTHEEVWRLADQMTGRDRVLLLVLAYGGLRWGEAAALRVGDVSDDGRRLRVSEAVSDVGGKLYVGTVKDHEARSVVLPKSVAVELLEWIEHTHPGSLLFPASNGSYLRNGNWRRNVLTPTARTIDRLVTPHKLRDTAATLAIQAGASVTTVARMLGHENPSTTLRHYAGYFPDDLDQVAKRLDTRARAVRRSDGR